jgi:hypothetical protein
VVYMGRILPPHGPVDPIEPSPPSSSDVLKSR